MKYRIHLYPVVRVTVDIEAETASEAIKQAVDAFDPYRTFPEPVAPLVWHHGQIQKQGFAEEYAGQLPAEGVEALVDPLDEDGILDENHPDYGYWTQKDTGLNWELKILDVGKPRLRAE